MNKTIGRSKSKKNNKITTKLGMVLVVSCLILLAVVVLYKAQSLKAQKESLQVQAAELQEQLDSAKEDYKKLEEREKYMQTDEYVEDVARSQLGLIYPDEIVVKPEELSQHIADADFSIRYFFAHLTDILLVTMNRKAGKC